MAITLDVAWQLNTSSASSIVDTLPSTTAGSSLVAIFHWYGTQTLDSVTVSSNSNMTIHGTQTGGPSNGRIAICSLAEVTTGGTLTVTATFSGSTNSGSFMAAFAGGDTSSWLDGTMVGDNGTTGDRDVNVTTGRANNMIVASLINNSGNTTDPSGYSEVSSTTVFWYDDVAYNLDVGAADTKDVQFGGSGGTWCIAAASFNIASAVVAVPGIEVHRFFPGASF